MQRLKPISLDKSKVKGEEFKNLDGFGNKVPLSGLRSNDISPTSGFRKLAPSILKKKGKDPNTATHKFENKAGFMMAPEINKCEPESSLPALDSALLPIGSGIPKMNAKKLNKDIQVSNKKERPQK